ncbi:hypothetical protein AXK11_08095 [Cephaloticoccus primus]|uniref:DUF2271 domain-containing protein n=1 Tax=Cephaloticoccus primus TaxID=1548207 RepID=A0A139SJF6_9BACT|nr:DUF2271 domain-containing protein [Cephaloticoccus primus]KXU34679.1 hypothetical protein AXK11_08095 [Cephaloticoccus primus]
MSSRIRHSLLRLAPGLAVASAASASELTATIELPRLDVAEYHRPYVAVWLEGPDKAHHDVNVWYALRGRGETWLKDIRQWWRKSGRTLELPIDGLSGPTRPVGTHEVKVPLALSNSLTEGAEYALVVEAVREVGGREVVRVPFTWSSSQALNASAKGERELGAVTLRKTD